MKRWVLFLVLLLSVSFVILPGISSAEEKISGRIVAHYTKMETVEVGDVPGHVLGVAQQTGLTFYSTGEVAKAAASFHFDLLKGKGTFSGYILHTIPDGSTLMKTFGGNVSPVDDGKKFVIEGKSECIGGTGKYEGFRGTGTFKGERIGELKTGGDAYYDFTFNCKKP